MSHQVAFSGQIIPEQIEKIKAQGFKTIINNRPDGEEANQPTSQEIKAAAEAAGLAYQEISFSGGALTKDHVERFADFFNQAQKPVFMFCRTGNRSNIIYQAAISMDLLDDENE